MSIPYRADQVGSLLRPDKLKAARQAWRGERISIEELHNIEDECIREVVARQEAVGLQAVTDGEFRRTWWHLDFLAGLEGVERVAGENSFSFKGVTTRADTIKVTDKVAFNGHEMLEHFRFLHKVAVVTPKMCIPAPSVLHFRFGRAAIDKAVYPDLDAFFSDTAAAYRQVVNAFYDAGCRYLQFDDTVWAYLCSDKERQAASERGDDPAALAPIYADMINHAIADRADDMVITTHVCRGNFRSSWIAEGGYEPIAETLLAGTNYDGYFLEYDTQRAGGFEPLRFLPAGDKRLVLGLVTSKFGELENVDTIKRRIDEASEYADPEQFCLSPQCGFSSTEEGNMLTADEQWNKLNFIVATAKEIWGKI